MSVDQYSQTAGSNTSVGGVSIAEGMSPSGVNNAMRAIMADIAAWRDDTGGSLTTTGSSNAYALTTAQTLAAYADGQELTFKANFTNTGAATLNVDGLGAKAIRKGADEALDADDILQNGYYRVAYNSAGDSSAGAWQIIGSVSSEFIQDLVGAMFTGNTETGVTVTYEDTDGTIDVVLSDEYLQDVAGAMLTGNTETGLDATYQDADGTIDIEVTGVLEDLNTLAANTGTNEFLVGTAAGTLAWQTGGTARSSMGAAASDVTQGKHTVNVLAYGCWPDIDNPAVPVTAEYNSGSNVFAGYDFDGAGTSIIHVAFPMPKSWSSTNRQLTFKFYWTTSAIAGTGTVRWQVQVRTYGNDDSIDTGSSASTSIDDPFIADKDLHISDEGSATPSASDEDMVLLRIFRVATDVNDTYTEDARLLAVMMTYVTDDDTDD